MLCAKHPTVISGCLAAFVPRCDVVGFHVVNVPVLLFCAHWAKALLLLIRLSFQTVTEDANVQVLFFQAEVTLAARHSPVL